MQDDAQTIGIGTLGYASMGPPPLRPELVAIAGRDGYRAAEVCDAIVRSAAGGRREPVTYR